MTHASADHIFAVSDFPLGPRPLSTFAACATVCIAYAVTGAAGVWLLQGILSPELAGIAATISIPWLPAGIGVAGLMLFGSRAWPGVYAGSCITWGLVQRDSWQMVLLGAASESLSIVLIAWLLRIWDYRASLERYRDALILIAAAAIGRVVTSATDVIGILAAVWLQPGATSPLILDEAGVHRSGNLLVLSPALLAYALRWWANTTAGVVLVVPLLALCTPRTSRQRPATMREVALWIVASIAWPAAALSLHGAELRLPLLTGALVLVVWAAVRFGVTVASIGSLAFSMAAAVGFGLQLGSFAGIGGREATQVAWGFIGILSVTALFLTALLSQRDRTRVAIAASGDRYRRLFLSNPYPVWAEDAASGEVLLANPAALREYGYDEAQFLRLRPSDLIADPGVIQAPDLPADRPVVTAERHRTRLGAEFEVEVTRVPLDVGVKSARVCFVEPMTERNAMRLAALTAADLERFRLSGRIATQLIPRLSRTVTGAVQLRGGLSNQVPIDEEALARLGDEVAAAIAVCKDVTRGASPLQSAGGDLAESLRRLPASLADLSSEVQISIQLVAPVALSVGQRDHIYRLAEDAVRMLAAGAPRVWVSLNANLERVRMVIENGDNSPGGRALANVIAHRSMAARAAAANGRLQVIARQSGGTVISFECAQELQAAPESGSSKRRLEEGRDSAARHSNRDANSDEGARIRTRRSWLYDVTLLTLAYILTAALCLIFVRVIDALDVSSHAVSPLPWLASGVAVVGLLLGGERLWPAVVVGYAAIWRGLEQEGWATVVIAAAAQAAATVVVVRLLRHFGFRRQFDRLRDLLLLIGAAAIGRALIVPADLLGLQFADAVSPLTASVEMRDVIAPAQSLVIGITAAKLEAVGRWWLNGVAGIVLFVPVLISWARPQREALSRNSSEFLLWLVGLVAAGVAILSVSAADWRLPILAFGLVVVTWAAVRFGAGLASTATLLLSLAATASFGLAQGTLAPSGPDEGLGILWGFILLLTVTALALTALLAGSDRAERELQDLNVQYRQLFEAVPHAVFAFTLADRTIRVANAATSALFGLAARALTNMQVTDLCADSRLLTVPRSDAMARELIEVSQDSRGGERMELEITRVALDLDGAPGVLCFVIDVSERNRLRTRVIEATDQERRNIARDFHDGLGQVLTGLHLGVASLQRAVQRGQILTEAGIEFVANTAEEALRTCELILRGVSPLQGRDGDLFDAIRGMPGRLPPDATVRLTTSVVEEAAVTLPLEAREHLYQIAQEAVTNCLKHAGATEVSVAIAVRPSEIEVCITDDGVGIDVTTPSMGLGLESIRTRTAALHGHLKIAQLGERGTILRCVCPQLAEAGGA